MAEYLRGQIAKLAGVHNETLRYYENNGLIPVPKRSPAGYRVYPEETVARIEFIKMAQFCGFTLSQVKKLLAQVEEKKVDTAYFCDILEARIKKIDGEMQELQKTKDVLANLKQNLMGQVRSPKMKVVLDTLKIE